MGVTAEKATEGGKGVHFGVARRAGRDRKADKSCASSRGRPCARQHVARRHAARRCAHLQEPIARCTELKLYHVLCAFHLEHELLCEIDDRLGILN